MNPKQERRAMLIGSGTYGYYYPDRATFRCTHGEWESQIVLMDAKLCRVRAIKGVCSYQFIDAIPQGYE